MKNKEEYKINIDRPFVSSEEIAGRRDFNALYGRFAKKPKPFYKKPWLLSSLIAIVLSSASFLIYQQRFVSTSEIKSTPPNILITNKITPVTEDKLTVAYEEYLIDLSEDVELKCKSGASIKIPAYAFIDKDGNQPAGLIKILYREVGNDDSNRNISFQHNHSLTDNPIESPVKAQLLAYSGGNELFLDPNKTIHANLIMDYPKEYYLSDKQPASSKINKKEPDQHIVSSTTENEKNLSVVMEDKVLKKKEGKLQNVREPLIDWSTKYDFFHPAHLASRQVNDSVIVERYPSPLFTNTLPANYDFNQYLHDSLLVFLQSSYTEISPGKDSLSFEIVINSTGNYQIRYKEPRSSQLKELQKICIKKLNLIGSWKPAELVYKNKEGSRQQDALQIIPVKSNIRILLILSHPAASLE